MLKMQIEIWTTEHGTKEPLSMLHICDLINTKSQMLENGSAVMDKSCMWCIFVNENTQFCLIGYL